jgi:hypothetical protein
MGVIEGFQSSLEVKDKKINQRNFKHFLFSVANLPPYEAENLIEHLDRDTDGFIPLNKVQGLLLPFERAQ